MKHLIVFALSAFISFVIGFSICALFLGGMYVSLYLWFCFSCAKVAEIQVLAVISMLFGGQLSLCIVEGIDYEISKKLLK